MKTKLNTVDLNFQLYKLTAESLDRNTRVNYALHPMYYMQIKNLFTKAQVNSDQGWELTKSHTLKTILSSAVWKTVIRHLIGSRSWDHIVTFLLKKTAQKMQMENPRLVYDSLLPDDEEITIKLLKAFGVTKYNIQEIISELELLVKSTIGDGKGEMSQGFVKDNKKSIYDLHVYSVLYESTSKVRFMLSEQYLLKHSYPNMLFTLRYSSTVDDPRIFNLMTKFENLGIKEEVFLWIEQLLEAYYSYENGVVVIHPTLHPTKNLYNLELTNTISSILNEQEMITLMRLLMSITELSSKHYLNFKSQVKDERLGEISYDDSPLEFYTPSDN